MADVRNEDLLALVRATKSLLDLANAQIDWDSLSVADQMVLANASGALGPFRMMIADRMKKPRAG